MKRTLMRRAAVAVAATSLAAGTSALFGGVAFASEHHHDSHDHNGPSDNRHYSAGHDNDRGGAGGSGGRANANCVIPLGVSAGVIGQGGDDSQCNAGGGSAGYGGDGETPED